MAPAPALARTIAALTRAEKKILADLQLFQDKHGVTRLSVRQIADVTGVPRSSVCRTIDKLNEAQLIQTLTGTSIYPTIHRIRFQDSLRPESCPTPLGAHA